MKRSEKKKRHKRKDKKVINITDGLNKSNNNKSLKGRKYTEKARKTIQNRRNKIY